MSILARAIRIASVGHEKQVDKGGKAYILHPLRLMFDLIGRGIEDEEILACAVLHDYIEDCVIDSRMSAAESALIVARELDRLRKVENISTRVTSALLLLTHLYGESYEKYIDGIATNQDAIKVKMADLRDNSRLDRMMGCEERDFKRQTKYMKAYAKLAAQIEILK